MLHFGSFEAMNSSLVGEHFIYVNGSCRIFLDQENILIWGWALLRKLPCAHKLCKCIRGISRRYCRYFTASRYWYRWSKYVTFKSAIILLTLFLSYFYMTGRSFMHVKVFFSGAFSSTTNQIAHYIQTQFKPEDIMEAHSTIWRLRLEQARGYKGIIRVWCSG